MNDAQREFLERVANSDHLIALGKVGSGSVAAALSDLSAKDRRIAELEAEIAGHPGALAAAKREGIEMAISHLEKSDCPIPIDRLPPGQTKRQFSNTVIEFLILELCRMAREVKP